MIFKSLITNLNSKLKKNLSNKLINKYCELHKLLNRQYSKQISSRTTNALISGNTKLINIEKKKFHRLFLKSQVILNLKLSKKVRTISFLVKHLKKSKKIKRKRWKRIKRKWLNSKKLILKKKFILRKKIILLTKYNALHKLPLTLIKFNIRNYLFLNKASHEASILNFYFKTISTSWKINKRNKKTLFFNFRNKKLTTFRNARKLHWGTCTHKRLNKRKYSTFITKWVKNTSNYWDTFKTHCMFKFNFSHQFWENFILLYRLVYAKALEFKVISQLPIHTMFWWFLNLQKKLLQKVSLKINFWQEKKIKIRKTFWMEQKKNLPKFIKKKLFRLYRSLSALHYDYITNSFIMLKNIQQPIHNNLYFINNKLLKLHNFKYKS